RSIPTFEIMKYSFEWKSFLVLKTWVIITWIFVWNIIFGIAIYFNGGLGPVKNPSAAYISAIALFGTTIFCFLVIYNKSFRSSILHNERGKFYESFPFAFVGVLTLFLGVASCLTI